MSLKTVRILGVAFVGMGSSPAASVVWDGGGGDGSWQTAANWDNDVVPGAADDITIGSGAAVVYTPGGDLVVDGGSLTINDGASWTQSPTNWTQINGGTLTLDHGTFTRSGGGNLVLAIGTGDSGTISASNSTIAVGGELWFGHNFNTGNQSAQVTLAHSVIDASGVVGIWFWDPDATGNAMTLNIVGAGSTVNGRVGRRNSGGADNAVTWETLWNEGILQFDGGNSGNFGDHFTTSGTPGTTGYSLTSVPEPASAILLGLGGLALLGRRSRALPGSA